MKADLNSPSDMNDPQCPSSDAHASPRKAREIRVPKVKLAQGNRHSATVESTVEATVEATVRVYIVIVP